MRLTEAKLTDLWVLLDSENEVILQTNDETQLPFIHQHMAAAASSSFGWQLLHYRLSSVVNNLSHKEDGHVSA